MSAEEILPLTSILFGGEGSEEYNALRSALATAALHNGYHGENFEYGWLEEVPRTSMIVELVDALHRHGYEIRRMPTNKVPHKCTFVSDGGPCDICGKTITEQMRML